MRNLVCVVAAALLWAAATQAADMEGRGRIFNADGTWCWFMQTVDKREVAFLTLKGTVATMVFDDPGCMAEAITEGLDFAAGYNRKQIAKRIAEMAKISWVTEDTAYDAANRFKPGMMQTAGECMVGAGKPATAIAINFVSDGTAISRVEYAGVYGCGDPL